MDDPHDTCVSRPLKGRDEPDGVEGVIPHGLNILALARLAGRDQRAMFLQQLGAEACLTFTRKPLRRPDESDLEFDTASGRKGDIAIDVVVPLKKRPGANGFTEMVTLGRASNNDIVVADPSMSKFHAYLVREGEAWRIADAGSTNGTELNLEPIAPRARAPLAYGDRLTFAGAVSAELERVEDLYRRLGGH